MIGETSVQDLARQQIAAAFAADRSALERLYADDVQYRDPDTRLSSRAAVLDHLRGQADAFAGFDFTISHTYGDSADGAVVEWSMSGEAGGKPVSLDIVTAYDFVGGRIVSERNYWDNAALQAQLGPQSSSSLPRPERGSGPRSCARCTAGTAENAEDARAGYAAFIITCVGASGTRFLSLVLSGHQPGRRSRPGTGGSGNDARIRPLLALKQSHSRRARWAPQA
jgi:ketosteroid isomerase-like protein